MKKIHCYVLIIIVFYGLKVTAGIVVIPNLINFTADALPRADVMVANEGDEEAYVKITPHTIVYSGTDKERKIIIHNPEHYGLLVTPQQLIIPPKQKRQVRFMLTKPFDDQERIYRIDIVPVAKDLIPTHHAPTKKANMGLQMLVGYGVLTMVRPLHPQLNVAVWREGNTLFLHNKGNSNVEVSNIEQCLNKNCAPVKNFVRLYAGNKRQIVLKRAAPTRMAVQLLDEQKMLTSN